MPFVILGFTYMIGSIITCAIGIVLLMKNTIKNKTGKVN